RRCAPGVQRRRRRLTGRVPAGSERSRIQPDRPAPPERRLVPRERRGAAQPVSLPLAEFRPERLSRPPEPVLRAHAPDRPRADGTVAVKDLDPLITDGEFLVLVGPSGCGKTTALRCLAGLEEITAGQIKIDARVVNRVPPKDRNIAMVFQSYALYPHMTVFDNLAFGLKLMKTPKDEIKRRVEEAAKILNLENLLDRKPRALSGGQRQRVALGRAIVR